MKTKILLILITLFSVFGCDKEQTSVDIEPFNVYYFYNQTCPHCKQVKEQLIPQIENKYKDKVTITAYDIDKKESVSLYDNYIGLYDKDQDEWLVEGVLEGVDQELACYERLVPLVVIDEYYAFLGYSSEMLDAYMQDIHLALQGRKLATGDIANDRWLFKKMD